MSEIERLARELAELRDKLVAQKAVLRASRERLEELEAKYNEIYQAYLTLVQRS